MPAIDSGLHQRQGGSVLLEAMVAVVIFSFGILAMISMQTAAVRSTSDAKYRADASFLAAQIVGQMWAASGATLDDFSNGVAVTAANASSCPTGGATATAAVATAWLGAVAEALPGADANRQQISVDPATGLLSVRVCWLDRSATDGTYHNHFVTAQINKNE